MNIKSVFIVGVSGLLCFSCVTKKKYDALNTKKSKLEVKNSEQEDENQVLLTDNQKLQKLIDKYGDELSTLVNDTTDKGALIRQLEENYLKDSKLWSSDAQKLAKKEIELNELEKRYIENQNQLKSDEEKISRLEKNLSERERRVSELEQKIAAQQQAVNQLKRKINAALLSFNEDELTVEMKNGKVYVSLSNQLLFKPGSYNVDTKGASAINKLADVLKSHDDLELIVEGHTDNDPYSGSGALVDNWDLSVKRATSITRLLQKRGVDPKQIAASGRSQYNPKVEGDSKEAKGANRRIEIIISPNLDELFNIIK